MPNRPTNRSTITNERVGYVGLIPLTGGRAAPQRRKMCDAIGKQQAGVISREGYDDDAETGPPASTGLFLFFSLAPEGGDGLALLAAWVDLIRQKGMTRWLRFSQALPTPSHIIKQAPHRHHDGG